MRSAFGLACCVVATLFLVACSDPSADEGPAPSMSGSGGGGGDSGSNAGTSAGANAGTSAGASAGTNAGASSSVGGVSGSGGMSGGASADASAGAGGTGSASASELDACIAYMKGFCELQGRCDGFTEAERETERVHCFARYAAYCPDALFAPGSLRTIENTLACAAAWPTLSCASYRREASPECVVPGMLALDEPCLFGTQCESRSCSAFGAECGLCDAVAQEGDACGAPACVRGTFCDDANGSTCSVSPPEDDVPATASAPALGEECDPSVGCGGESQALCDRDPMTGDDRCMAWPKLGEDCADAGACQYGDSFCGSDSKCTALPADGAPCAMGLRAINLCGPDQTCDTFVTPAICRPRPRAGEVCLGPCASGLTCMCEQPGGCEQRLCRRVRLPGETCTDSADLCLPGATRCENGVCVGVGMQGLVEQKCGM